MTSLQKATKRVSHRNIWGWLLCNHPHIFRRKPSSGSFFSGLTNYKQRALLSECDALCFASSGNCSAIESKFPKKKCVHGGTVHPHAHTFFGSFSLACVVTSSVFYFEATPGPGCAKRLATSLKTSHHCSLGRLYFRSTIRSKSRIS